MSLADCEEEITTSDPPAGFELYCSTRSGTQLKCEAPPASRYEIEITNKRSNPIGVVIDCESPNGYIEFSQNGSYEKDWRDTILVEGRTPQGGTTKTVSIDIQSTASSKTTETITTEINEEDLMMPGNPPIKKDIDVDAK